MKHLLLSFVAIFLFVTQVNAQTHSLINAADADGSANFEYYLDSNKILHFSIQAQSNHPFAFDTNSYENQVILEVSGVYFGQFVVEFNECDFPFGSPSNYTGTFDLSAYSLTEIAQMEISGHFDFKINDEVGGRYRTFYNSGENIKVN